MELRICENAQAAAQAAAEYLAQCANEAVARHGAFSLAASGGSEPWEMFGRFAREDVPWERVQLFQVDERVAPHGHAERNWTRLEAHLVARVPLLAQHAHPMPVEEDDLDLAAARYTGVLSAIAGAPPVLDLVHLGLGTDGHTASLVPGDAVLDKTESEVAVTASYQGHRRMTFTYAPINRARRILWFVVGQRKARALAGLLAGDARLPASRVRQGEAVVIADQAAARG